MTKKTKKLKSILKWMAEHTRPWFYRKSNQEREDDIIEDVKENTKVGFKIKFKF